MNGPGLHEVAAAYAGDINYLPSTSPTTELQVQVADPVFSVASGIYTSEQTLTITDTTPGATILYVNGSGFTGASSAYWGATALTTHFVSSAQLTATVPASDISTAGIVALTIQTPQFRPVAPRVTR